MEIEQTTTQNPETMEAQTPENENPPITLTPPTASISLSISTLFPTHFFTPTKISHLFSPKNAKLPPQITSAISTLSLSSSNLSPPKPFFKKSSFSASPLQNPLFINPKLPAEPSNGAAARRATIVWFRNDLRVHDNECLTTANNESMSVLPLYCFDPREYGKLSSGFDKTGPFRASFLIESVSDLRKNLRERGSDLVVRIGKPEAVLVEMVKAIGADAVYVHREVSKEEAKSEGRIEAAMKDEGVEVKYFWGSTLYHLEDLPFKLEEMPINYGGFREKVQGLKVRETIAALDQLKGLPSQGDVEPGEIPSLVELGLNPNATLSQDAKPAANASLVGGETEAMQRLQKFAAECNAQPPKSKDGTNSIYGANFSCKISPWLAMGCLSPRFMFDELKKTASRTISAKNPKNGDDGMNWLMFELLWRDFFRFITAKYSSTKKLVDATPATACTSALA
ncbi:blue-light photoreceptor PHR2-like [Amaranthus tricolor]|uniref:blue-light photoreceptor PHR2-like n=1 Tax=Amaranthus tricolor TaxID=29722 RepID=UPI00258C0B9B|nr:blue-light photoreceptor PHR2-like [Amaranthus tricolor]